MDVLLKARKLLARPLDDSLLSLPEDSLNPSPVASSLPAIKNKYHSALNQLTELTLSLKAKARATCKPHLPKLNEDINDARRRKKPKSLPFPDEASLNAIVADARKPKPSLPALNKPCLAPSSANKPSLPPLLHKKDPTPTKNSAEDQAAAEASAAATAAAAARVRTRRLAEKLVQQESVKCVPEISDQEVYRGALQRRLREVRTREARDRREREEAERKAQEQEAARREEVEAKLAETRRISVLRIRESEMRRLDEAIAEEVGKIAGLEMEIGNIELEFSDLEREKVANESLVIREVETLEMRESARSAKSSSQASVLVKPSEAGKRRRPLVELPSTRQYVSMLQRSR